MKSVCIIGAGPAGLAAAKTFLQSGHFDVTVYEKSHRIGGIWALDENSKDGFLNPQTPTNLSKFTVGFSDLDWNSVDLERAGTAEDERINGAKGQVPAFPKAWQVNRYLEAYKQKYVPEKVLHLNSEILKAERLAEGWTITAKDHSTQTVKESTFDYLVIASGFFSTPRALKQNVAQLPAKMDIKSIHSSQFRSLDDLFEGQPAKGRTILLVGGGNSSGETGAAIAMQLSDAQWSTDETKQKLYQDCKIVHVLPRPLYAIPPFNEYEKDSRSYVPLDFKLYDFSKRPADMPSYGGHQPTEVRDIVHETLQTMVGNDQSDLGAEALVSPKDKTKGTVYVTLSESYSEFVRSGLIQTIDGRVSAIETDDSGTTNATISSKNAGTVTVDDIGAIVYATGYTPTTALEFLDEDVKKALHYDPTSFRLPIILEQWQTMNPAVPELAFFGFYEGPYWPMIEMQARMTIERWLNGTMAPTKPFEQTDTMLELREHMRNRDRGVPQYWFGDYMGYMEDVASFLSLNRNDGAFATREGCTSPARYLTAQSETAEANGIMHDLHTIWQDCTKSGRFVARAAFRALQGNWIIKRRIVSSDSNFSGTLEGTASFHPRYPTADKSKQVFDLEYLYIESGSFTSASGLKMTATRRYVYRYAEATDKLSIWFVKPDKRALDVDYLFHNLDFVTPEEARKEGACVAKADHLCVEDMYWTEYRMPLKGIILPEFQIRHEVKGPKKDYVATTEYRR